MIWPPERSRALKSTIVLVEVLGDPDVDDGRLLAAYLEAKLTLADCFEVFAREQYGDPAPLEKVRSVVADQIRFRFAFLPERFVQVRGYGPVHQRIFNYLVQQVGRDVSGWDLRALAGDAVHTERRARELRDVGMRLVTRTASGHSVYVLESASPDLRLGAWLQACRAVRESVGMSGADREGLLARLGERPDALS